MFYETYVLFLCAGCMMVQGVKCTLYGILNANCDDSHLYSSQDGQGPAAKDGVLQDSRDVLIAGLHQTDRLAEGEGQRASPVMVLEVVANWEVAMNRNPVLCEVISWTHT